MSEPTRTETDSMGPIEVAPAATGGPDPATLHHFEIGTDTFPRPLIRALGYRRFLVMNTVLVGLGIMSFALIDPEQPHWLRVVQLTLFGGVNSMQFTAMNSFTLKELDMARASAGNQSCFRWCRCWR
ncbi:MAG: hypothetical protein HC902_13710 [Calothrix sp. SM1_5_4]|nr:hypothetical protein [Calothrix sp. SM1_5_4]